MRKSLLVLLVLLWAAPAFADNPAWSGNCQFSGGNITGTIGTPVSTNTLIGEGKIGCYRFNSGAGIHNSLTYAPLITVSADSAVILFDPQLDATVAAATAALVIPHVCPAGVVITAASPQNSCPAIGGAGSAVALDGVEGPPGTQNAAIRVGPGLYYFEISGACLAGDTCQISVKGEEQSQ